MNLIEQYLQKEDNRHTIINSQKLYSQLTGNYEVSDFDSGRIRSGVAVFGIGGGGEISYSDITDATITTTGRSNLDVIEGRVAMLESDYSLLTGNNISAINTTPMTAVFQGSTYEIILEDGSVIRATNFQIREVRDEVN